MSSVHDAEVLNNRSFLIYDGIKLDNTKLMTQVIE